MVLHPPIKADPQTVFHIDPQLTTEYDPQTFSPETMDLRNHIVSSDFILQNAEMTTLPVDAPVMAMGSKPFIRRAWQKLKRKFVSSVRLTNQEAKTNKQNLENTIDISSPRTVDSIVQTALPENSENCLSPMIKSELTPVTDSFLENGVGNSGTGVENIEVEDGNTDDVTKTPEPEVGNSDILLPMKEASLESAIEIVLHPQTVLKHNPQLDTEPETQKCSLESTDLGKQMIPIGIEIPTSEITTLPVTTPCTVFESDPVLRTAWQD